MFHVELRQFPHVARTFNLTPEELQTRILAPWLAEKPVELSDRRWAPERARLTVYEGPELRTDEIGLGRGWANVTKQGANVTDRVLAEGRRQAERDPAAEQLAQEILGLCAGSRVPIRDTVRLASALYPRRPVSDRIALAERAIWELLQRQRVTLVLEGDLIEPERWREVLLSWPAWSEQGPGGPHLQDSP